jgi:hypothetical protein
MTVNDDDLRDAWQERRTDTHRDRSACLLDDQWARLLSNEATDAERSQAADHVGRCADCAAEYRLMLSVLSELY